MILTAAPQKSPKFFMDYFDLYYAYLSKCEKSNWINLRDPNHDYMEWNHTLPQCMFKGHGPGQWLTIEQHAIASALQTLAFETNCLFGGMLKHLPEGLRLLCNPYFSRMCSLSKPVFTEEDIRQRSSRMRQRNLEMAKSGTHPMQVEQSSRKTREKTSAILLDRASRGELWRQSEAGRAGATKENAKRVLNGTHNLLGKEAGERVSKRQKARVEKREHQWQTEEHRQAVSSRMKGTKHWVNPKGERKMQAIKPEGEWQNGRVWRDL